MTAIVFDPVSFRAQFPAFQCTPPIPDSVLQGYFDTATIYINNRSGGCFLGGLGLAQLQQALYLMTAHLGAISRLISQDQVPGVLISATVDKITVSMEPPPATNQWQYWLQTTPYGQQLFALLQVAGIGGRYIGGNPVVSSFRRVGW